MRDPDKAEQDSNLSELKRIKRMIKESEKQNLKRKRPGKKKKRIPPNLATLRASGAVRG
jgi:hypothetical protein